jgi:succinate dehydrogenase hydrophobic anchor subunit
VPKPRIHHNKHDNKKRIARTLKQRLAILITFLIVIILALAFKIGEALWPIWVNENRVQIAAFITFILLLVILFSPIIIETEVDPRPLSEPGHNPKGPRLP